MSYDLIDAGENFVRTSTYTLASFIRSAIKEQGRCTLALSGGSTPGPVYEALGKLTDIDWNAVHVCLIDERYVPANNDDSNQKLIRARICANADIPSSNIHFPDTTKPIDECIADYSRKIEMLQPIDVAVLGMGSDGHIASLFPPLTDAAFGPSSVIHATTDEFAVHDRISLTLPILKEAKESVLLLKTDKLDVWDAMLASDEDAKRWPLKAIIESSPLMVITNR
jgi:6-phosphogluconolactonase